MFCWKNSLGNYSFDKSKAFRIDVFTKLRFQSLNLSFEISFMSLVEVKVLGKPVFLRFARGIGFLYWASKNQFNRRNVSVLNRTEEGELYGK